MTAGLHGEGITKPAVVQELSELLKFIVGGIVATPAEILVNDIQSDRAVILEVKVNTDDIGKVIGKKGRIIRSIRLIMKAAAIQRRTNVSVEIVS